MIDCHVHTWRCRHATGTPVEYVRAAAERGISVLTFTEHLPLAPDLADRVPGAARYAMPESELPLYIAEIAEAATLGSSLGVEVLCGIEVDAVPIARPYAREMLAQHSFDVVLGSVHFIDDWAFDDPSLRDGYDVWSPDALWERYFGDVLDAARAGLADVMAHVDLVKKFGVWPSGPADGMYRETASALAEAGVAVEVNTAGLRKPCQEIYPGAALLRALREAGVPVTIGSDAHTPDEVGAGGAEALAALGDAGFRSVVVFSGREMREVRLDEL
ncbi:MAG: histidinol-phosphatase HisJ family protein [Coriobacteriia bacterium]|nr:histidinol-phosphatase HisJ family protein [Coriobacteriia bacterium]